MSFNSDNVLLTAMGKFDKIIVLGVSENGELEFTSSCSVSDTVFLIESFKIQLLTRDFDEHNNLLTK